MTAKSIKKQCYNYNYGLAHSKFYEGTPVDSLRIEKLGTPTCPVYHLATDVKLIASQRSLVDKLGLDYVKEWLNGFNNAAASSQPSNEYTDDQLLSFMKSRHIQQIGDLQEWREALKSRSAELKSDFDKQVLKRDSKQKLSIELQNLRNQVKEYFKPSNNSK